VRWGTVVLQADRAQRRRRRRLARGLKDDIIRRSGDPLGGLTYGDHNDVVAYFPIDTLEGGNNPEDGIAWVNHEYINLMFWSGYTDPEGATRKTKEQISREKAGVGNAIVRVRKNGDSWGFVDDDELNRRIDPTTPMGVTGPATGSPRCRWKGRARLSGRLATVAAASRRGTSCSPARRPSKTTTASAPTTRGSLARAPTTRRRHWR